MHSRARPTKARQSVSEKYKAKKTFNERGRSPRKRNVAVSRVSDRSTVAIPYGAIVWAIQGSGSGDEVGKLTKWLGVPAYLAQFPHCFLLFIPSTPHPRSLRLCCTVI